MEDKFAKDGVSKMLDLNFSFWGSQGDSSITLGRITFVQDFESVRFQRFLFRFRHRPKRDFSDGMPVTSGVAPPIISFLKKQVHSPSDLHRPHHFQGDEFLWDT